MKIKDVAKLNTFDRFCYWIRERHEIHLKRKAGNPKPWTDDEVLQSFFFTNPYRENDKVTVWFRENVRDRLRDDISVLFATIAFRWFNYIPTANRLIDCLDGYPFGRLQQWNGPHVIRVLDAERKKGKQIFTGAYMINSPAGKPKLEAIVDRITAVWRDIKNLQPQFIRRGDKNPLSLQEAHQLLTQYDGLGGFMAYEIVCDLRYTYLLKDAPDKMTWCNPGPGAIRGMYRMTGKEIKNKSNATSPPRPKDILPWMRGLLRDVREALPDMPRFEMREIEHSLCEFDKYERARLGDGRMKRTYKGV